MKLDFSEILGVNSILIGGVDISQASFQEEQITVYVVFDEFVARIVLADFSNQSAKPELNLFQFDIREHKSLLSGSLCNNIALSFVKRTVSDDCCLIFDEVNSMLLHIKLDFILNSVEILSFVQLPCCVEVGSRLGLYCQEDLNSFTVFFSSNPTACSFHGGFTQMVRLQISSAQKNTTVAES